MTQLREFPDYSITKDGRIFRTTFRNAHTYRKLSNPQLLKGAIIHGYHQIVLSQDGRTHYKYVHNIVLETFVGECPEGKEASHINNNRLDNRLENLCYETSKENNARKHIHGTDASGEKSPFAKLKEDDVREIRRLLEAGNRQKDIAIQFNITEACISKIATNVTWKHLDGKRKTWKEWAKDKEALENKIKELEVDLESVRLGADVVINENLKQTKDSLNSLRKQHEKRLVEKDKLIQELRKGKPDCDDCFRSFVKEKMPFKKLRDDGLRIVKDIRSMKLPDADLHDALWVLWRDYFDSNSRDFWKAEAIRLKKENDSYKNDLESILDKKLPEHFRKIIDERVQQDRSGLRDDIRHMLFWHRGKMHVVSRKEVLKAIDSRRTA
jgi:hypothetical protein